MAPKLFENPTLMNQNIQVILKSKNNLYDGLRKCVNVNKSINSATLYVFPNFMQQIFIERWQ